MGDRLPRGDPCEIEAALAAEMEGLSSVTDQEIERAVALTETALVRQIEQVGQRADLVSMFDQFFDDPARLNGELERLRAVTPADVSAFVERVSGPGKSGRPDVRSRDGEDRRLRVWHERIIPICGAVCRARPKFRLSASPC